MSIGIPSCLESVQLPQLGPAWLVGSEERHRPPFSLWCGGSYSAERDPPDPTAPGSPLAVPSPEDPMGFRGFLPIPRLVRSLCLTDLGWDDFWVGVLETVLYLEVLPGKAAAGREQEEGEGPQPALWGSHVWQSF